MLRVRRRQLQAALAGKSRGAWDQARQETLGLFRFPKGAKRGDQVGHQQVRFAVIAANPKHDRKLLRHQPHRRVVKPADHRPMVFARTVCAHLQQNILQLLERDSRKNFMSRLYNDSTTAPRPADAALFAVAAPVAAPSPNGNGNGNGHHHHAAHPGR